MNQTLFAGPERRKNPRFGVIAAVSLVINGKPLAGFTRNIGNRGAYLLFPTANSCPQLHQNELVEFVVELPAEVTLSSACQVWCSGRVLRVEESTPDMTGIAAEILDYSISKTPSSDRRRQPTTF